MSVLTEFSNVKNNNTIDLSEESLMDLDNNGEEGTNLQQSPNFGRFQARQMFLANNADTPDLFITQDEDIECIIPLILNFKHNIKVSYLWD